MKKVGPKMKIRMFRVVDLFCGVGGLTHGFVMEDFEVVAGIDFDNTCKFAFETNNNSRFIHGDLTKFDHKKIGDLFSKSSIKIWSAVRRVKRFQLIRKEVKLTTNGSFYILSEKIKKIKPHVVSMENVPNC